MPEELRNPENGRFLPGNRFWEARSTAGPKPKFKDPEPLWLACCEYFEWVEKNPLWEDKVLSYQGKASHEPSAKMRAMTIGSLCLFLDIEHRTWNEWKKTRSDLLPVITQAEQIIKAQKFQGAAAELLNPNIIARDLGLSDKTMQEHTGKDGGPIEITKLFEEIDGRTRGLPDR